VSKKVSSRWEKPGHPSDPAEVLILETSSLAVVREHYLRADIPCGSLLCEKCDPLYTIQNQGQLALPDADEDGASSSTAIKHKLAPLLSVQGRRWEETDKGHYLVIDTNVALHQVHVSFKLLVTYY
jgi:hypothetical protein